MNTHFAIPGRRTVTEGQFTHKLNEKVRLMERSMCELFTTPREVLDIVQGEIPERIMPIGAKKRSVWSSHITILNFS